MKMGIIKLAAMCLMLSAFVTAQSGGNFNITESVIAGGGATNSSGGNFSVAGTIGQAVAGNELVGGQFALTSGFWNYTPNAPATVGVEGDVAPRPNGDLSVLSNDVVQMRLFLNCSGTQPAITPNEFQRADSSPLDVANGVFGDGLILSNDIVQTRRYLNVVDQPQAGAGPTSPAEPRCVDAPETDSRLGGGLVLNGGDAPDGNVRRIIVENAISSSPNRVTVRILVDAVGDEAEYGFRINYSTAVFAGPGPNQPVITSAGTVAAGSRTCNVATAGRLNCSIGAFPPQPGNPGDPDIGEIPDGNGQVFLRVTFTVLPGVAPQSSPITLQNINVSDDAANLLAISGVNGAVQISGPTTATAAVGGRVLTPEGRGLINATVTLSDGTGNTRTARTSTFGYYRFEGVPAGQSYVVSVRSKTYQFMPQIFMLTDDVGDINFFGNR